LPCIGTHINCETDVYTKETTEELRNVGKNLLSLCADSEELGMFETEAIQDLIEFKWIQFSWSLHFFGCCIHMGYIVILLVYSYLVYVKAGDNSDQYNWALLAGVIYPAFYEAVQMHKCGIRDYMSDTGNYIDIIYIWGSIAMSVIHGIKTPYHSTSILLMCIVAILAVRRTFNFLKIFTSLSPIVTMLTTVIWQLRIFLTFYFIQTLLFSLMVGVLGLGNYKLQGSFRENFFVHKDQHLLNCQQ